MAKVYLKKSKSTPYSCVGCYFWQKDKDCPRPANGKKGLLCGDLHIYKKITERTAKKLLKSGWRRSDAML